MPSSVYTYLNKRYVGRLFTLTQRGRKPVRKRITEVLNYDPSDRSVGIFIGSLTIETADHSVYDLVSNGQIEEWKDPNDYEAGVVIVGRHNFDVS
jgi:hypothetical protein